jgi:hypothetical protein
MQANRLDGWKVRTRTVRYSVPDRDDGAFEGCGVSFVGLLFFWLPLLDKLTGAERMAAERPLALIRGQDAGI